MFFEVSPLAKGREGEIKRWCRNTVCACVHMCLCVVCVCVVCVCVVCVCCVCCVCVVCMCVCVYVWVVIDVCVVW